MMIMNEVRIWKGTVFTYVMVLSCHSPIETEENHKNISGELVVQPSFKLGTS